MRLDKMNSLNHKIKINNSYESEPSSSSGGSSLSEHNDCHLVASIGDNMQLKYLLQAPPSFENEVTITTTIEPEHHELEQSPKYKLHIQPIAAAPTMKTYIEQIPTFSSPPKLLLRPLHSSEESSFEGFSETSPFGSIHRHIYGVPKKQGGLTPGKMVFPRFYDTIVEENSCNAVDMKLSNEPVLPQECIHSTSETIESIEITAVNASELLSFNGKIKGLTSTVMHLPPLPSVSTAAPHLPTVYEVPTTSTTSSATLVNYSQLSESFILKKYTNEKSPDLFGEDDDDEDEGDNVEVDVDVSAAPAELAKHNSHCETSANQSLTYCPTESSFNDDQTLDFPDAPVGSDDTTQTLYRKNCRREREMLRRVRKCLAGIPPPPSMTIPQLDLFSAVLSRKRDILDFFNEAPSTSSAAAAAVAPPSAFSLLKPTHTVAETQAMPWKDILGVRQHGLSFNYSKSSESCDYLSLAVVDRFIGAETASSYCNSPSSAKKRITRLKMLTQSPGNRLSHLAKRRAIFSSANLATTSQKTSSSVGPQILLDKKKPKNRRKSTPKRTTPGSKKKHRKTPTSSARKRLFRYDLNHKPSGPSRETSKRALFQSPAKQLPPVVAPPPKPLINPAIANRVEKSKRVLFSSDDNELPSTSTAASSYLNSFPFANAAVSKASSSSSMKLDSLLLKRKRNPADDDDSVGSSKLFCGGNLTPRTLKIKSQSFCGGAGSSAYSSASAATATSSASTLAGVGIKDFSASNLASSRNSLGYYSSSGTSSMQRAHSDMSTCSSSNSLTENQRKKLLWAVSQALQEKKIAGAHDSFKGYASVLARVVRRIYQEYYQHGTASTSDTMLRLAKKHVYNVMAGKNEDDLYLQAKAQLDDIKRQSRNRVTGYIGREEYQKRRQQSTLSQTSDAAENSIDSFGFSQTSSVFGGASSGSVATPAAGLVGVGVGGGASQSSFLGNNFSQEMAMIAKQFPIQPNAALQNSSSKNNLGGLALRENVDCEQRRSSAQKNYFTGKDQRNVSPYATANSGTASSRLGSAIKATSQTQPFAERSATAMTMKTAAAAKAKRQINFDS